MILDLRRAGRLTAEPGHAFDAAPGPGGDGGIGLEGRAVDLGVKVGMDDDQGEVLTVGVRLACEGEPALGVGLDDRLVFSLA